MGALMCINYERLFPFFPLKFVRCIDVWVYLPLVHLALGGWSIHTHSYGLWYSFIYAIELILPLDVMI